MTRASPYPIRWGLIFAVWTGYGLLGAAQEHLSYAMSRSTPLPWWTALLMQMPLAYTWALATPVILWLGRRVPFERGRWGSGERRVGEEGRSRGAPDHLKKKKKQTGRGWLHVERKK